MWTRDLPAQPALTDSGEAEWLLSFDFDGTLWSRDASPGISAGFFDLMRCWRSCCGVRWGINTGRSLNYLLEEFNRVAPFSPDFIVTCERYVYRADEENGVLRPDMERNTACRHAHEEVFRLHHVRLEDFFVELRRRHPASRWSRDAEDPYSIEVEHMPDLDLFSPLVAGVLKDCPELSVQRAGPYLRFCHTSYNKGTSLRHIAGAWGVPEERIAILGDGHNDLDAFRLHPGALCACPCNAHAEIKIFLRERGGYVSPYAEHEGVMDILETRVAPLLRPGNGEG